jgi:hypothetical protein
MTRAIQNKDLCSVVLARLAKQVLYAFAQTRWAENLDVRAVLQNVHLR